MKREITKEDIGKMFRVAHDYDADSRGYEVVCSVEEDGLRYWYVGYNYLRRVWKKAHVNSCCGPYINYSFEEVNALTAIVLFGSDIPKEFKGYEEVEDSQEVKDS